MNSVSEEIRLRLKDPLIIDKAIKTVLKYPLAHYRNDNHRRRSMELDIKILNMHRSLYKMNFPVAISKERKILYNSWDKLTQKDKKRIEGVILSENFDTMDVYLVLFK
jgi:hypothetical protein